MGDDTATKAKGDPVGESKKLLFVASALAVLLLLAGCRSSSSDSVAAADGDQTEADGSTASGGDADDGADDAGTDTAADGADDEADSTPTTEGTTTTEAPVAAPVDGPIVELVDAGAEPRTELRLAIADGTMETMVTDMTQSISQEVDGTPLSAVTTSVVTETAIAVATVDGGFQLSSEVTGMEAGPEADPAVVAAMEDAAAQMIGLITVATLDERGIVLDQQTSDSGNPTVDQMVDSVAGISAPFPAEPVGVGATWTVTQVLDLAGVLTTQTATYTVVELDGSTLVLDATVAQSVEPDSKLVQGGISLDVLEWTNDGTGRLTIDLTKVTPSSSMTSIGTQVFGVPGTDERLTQTIETEVTISAG